MYKKATWNLVNSKVNYAIDFIVNEEASYIGRCMEESKVHVHQYT